MHLPRESGLDWLWVSIKSPDSVKWEGSTLVKPDMEVNLEEHIIRKSKHAYQCMWYRPCSSFHGLMARQLQVHCFAALEFLFLILCMISIFVHAVYAEKSL